MREACVQCPRKCGRDRRVETGYCGVKDMPVVARIAPHFDEEPCISGTGGSGTVFFSGCALKCVFCQNETISHGGFGREMTVPGLRRAIEGLIEGGCHNVNFVNPTHFGHIIEELLTTPFQRSVVWNSGGYESVETIKRLEGKVQIYLPDVKFHSAALSKRLCGAEDYFERARAAILEMARQVGPARFSPEGIMISGLLVRHLILPGCTDDSMRVLNFIAREIPDAHVSLMAQYVPCATAKMMEGLNRRITKSEYEAVLSHLYTLGIENGYVQELSSAEDKYIPAFDLTGVVWDNGTK